jgi:hypothetical protein
MTGIGTAPGGAVVAEDVRDFQLGTRHDCGLMPALSASGASLALPPCRTDRRSGLPPQR